jgi:predicted transcriptional regulator YdeE
MQKERLKLEEIKLVGITTITDNDNESSLKTTKILPCVQTYFGQKIYEKIKNRKKPGTTFAAYTNYDSKYVDTTQCGYKGSYTYFLGEEVTSFDDISEGLETLIIPVQDYIKFTTNPGVVPNIIRDAWKEIWGMSTQNLGGIRRYLTDFEIHDERMADRNSAILDVYIGIN